MSECLTFEQLDIIYKRVKELRQAAHDKIARKQLEIHYPKLNVNKYVVNTRIQSFENGNVYSIQLKFSQTTVILAVIIFNECGLTKCEILEFYPVNNPTDRGRFIPRIKYMGYYYSSYGWDYTEHQFLLWLKQTRWSMLVHICNTLEIKE